MGKMNTFFRLVLVCFRFSVVLDSTILEWQHKTLYYTYVHCTEKAGKKEITVLEGSKDLSLYSTINPYAIKYGDK